jgi:hypothetical protein
MENFKVLTNVFFLLITVFVMSSCDGTEDPEPDGEYKSGIFVANQGVFQTGTGTVTFWDRDSLKTKQKIFETVNNRQIGNILQSITIYNGRAYLVVNNASKVEVVDAETFEEIGVITGVDLPRYFVGVDETTGYLSGWGATGVEGYIKTIDLESLTVTKTMSTGSGTGRMRQFGNYIFATNSGGFGRDSTVVVVDIAGDSVLNKIELADNPQSVILDGDGNIWVLCQGYSDWNNSANNTNGQIAKINPVTYAVENTMDLPGGGAVDLVYNDDMLYFSFFGVIYSQDINNATFDNNVFVNKYFYGLGYDTYSGYLNFADAGDFASDGQIFRYDVSGNFIDSITVGIAPSNMAFTE